MATTDHPARHDSPEIRADRIVHTFRRVSWQRIEVDGAGGGRGLVTGTRHRLPTTVEVPLDVALVLRRRGVRSVIRRTEKGQPSMVVCHCAAVNDRAIRAEIESGALDADALADRCGAGARCGSCRPVIEAILATTPGARVSIRSFAAA